MNSTQHQNPSVKFLRLAHLRKLRRCEQVAAICFRVRGSDIEFLLVQTGKGRWIFPREEPSPDLHMPRPQRSKLSRRQGFMDEWRKRHSLVTFNANVAVCGV